MTTTAKTAALAEYNRLHDAYCEALEADAYDAQNDALHGKIAIRNALRKQGFGIELDSSNRARAIVSLA